MNPISQSSLIIFINWTVLLTWLMALLFYVRKKFCSWSRKEVARHAFQTSYVDATESMRRVYELHGWHLLLHGDVQDTFETLAWLRVLVEQAVAPNAPHQSATEARIFGAIRSIKTIYEFRQKFKDGEASARDFHDSTLSPLAGDSTLSPLVGAAWWMAKTGQQRIAHLL